LKKVESFCTGCEWRGDGAGLSACPLCGAPIAALDVDESAPKKDEEYPEKVLKKEGFKDIDVKDI